MSPVRRLTFEDVADVVRIYDAMRAGELQRLGLSWTAQQLENECRTAFGWVHSVGASGIDAFLLYRDTTAALEISLLATDPSARGKGRMLSLLGQFLADRPPGREVWLEVHEANAPARRLYSKVGFREVGQRPKYYADGAAAILYNYG